MSTNFIRYIWQYHSNQACAAAILTQLFQQTIFTDKYIFSVIVRDGDEFLISIYIYILYTDVSISTKVDVSLIV